MKAIRRWIIIILGGIVALTLLAAGAVAFLLSRIEIGPEIERVVEANTGRDLTIGGEVGITFWPVLGLRAENATLSNVEGGRAEHFISMEELDIGVQLRPLFNREVVVERLFLRRPQIALEVDVEGQPNWVLQQPPSDMPPPPTSEPSVRRASLREIRIHEGELSFVDARRNTGWLVGDANLRTSLEDLDQPMRVEGDVRYNDHQVELMVSIGMPRAAMNGERTTVRIEAESDLVTFGFDGQTIAASGELAGAVQIAGPSLRQLAAWTGAPIEGGVGLENFSVAGRIAIGEGLLHFTNASFTLDRISGRGDFTIAEARNAQASAPDQVEVRNRPYLSGRLELFDFDANPYLSGETPTSAPVAAAAATAPTKSAPTAQIAVVEAPQRALDVQAAASEAPIDFSGLHSINAQLELVTHAVLVQHLRVDSARLNLDLHNGYLAATLHDVRLYGGSGRGRFEINAQEPSVRIVQEIVFDNVDARAFLADAVNFSSMEGRAELNINLRTQGRTQSEMISSVDGRVHLEVVSGVLHGVDLGGVASTIRNAVRGELIAPEARTPFHGMSGTFAVADGVLASGNLSFNTPDLRIPGIGVIDLNARRLDVRLAPRSPRGGIVVPFSVRGPFGQFAYASDITDRAQREIQTRVTEVQVASRAN